MIYVIMKRTFKQWWSTILQILTKRTTITSHRNSLNNKKPRHMTLEIHVLAQDRHKYVAGLNRLMESQHSPFDNWISNDNTLNIISCSHNLLFCSHKKDILNCSHNMLSCSLNISFISHILITVDKLIWLDNG